MSHGCVYNIVHDDLGYRKVCSRWVPRQLSDDHKCAWQLICQEHLEHRARQGDAFLHWNVTGDTSWVYHYELESKRQSMQWKHLLSTAKNNSRHRLLLGKSWWPSFGMPMALYWCTSRKRVKLWIVLDAVTCKWMRRSPRYDRNARDLSQKEYCCFTTSAPYSCAYSGYTTCPLIWGVETSTTQSGFSAIGLSLVWTYERTFARPEVCRWQWGNGGGAKLVKGHAKKLFSKGHPQACGQVDQVCFLVGGLCRKIRHKQFL